MLVDLCGIVLFGVLLVAALSNELSQLPQSSITHKAGLYPNENGSVIPSPKGKG